MQAVGAILGLKFLKMILSEHTLMQVGMISVICSLVMMAFVKSKRALFVGKFGPTCIADTICKFWVGGKTFEFWSYSELVQ